MMINISIFVTEVIIIEQMSVEFSQNMVVFYQNMK